MAKTRFVKESKPVTDGSFDADAYVENALNRAGSYGEYNTAGYDPSTKQIAIPQEEWDYRGAQTGMNGEALPFGAESWDAFGRPYYGEGLAGYWNGVVSRISSPTKQMPQYQQSDGDEKALEWFGRIIGNIGESFKLSDTYGIDSPMTYALRTSKEVIGGALQALQLPAIAVERGIGVFTPAISSQARTTKEALEAGRIAYSSFGNTALVSTFLTRYRDGENPELLAMELQNPGWELIGQIILDPLIVVGWLSKGGKAASATSRAARGWGMVDDISDASALVNKLDDTTNSIKAAEMIENLTTTVQDTIGIFKATRLKQEYGLAATVATGRQAEFVNRVSDGVAGITAGLKNAGYSNLDVIETFHDIARAASDNIEISNTAVLALNQSPLAGRSSTNGEVF